MTIEQIIDTTLAQIKCDDEVVPYYCGVPAFDDVEPDTFIFYDYYDLPVHYAGDKYHEIGYYITINLISSDINKIITLTKAIKQAFEDNGFAYQSSGTISDTDSVPTKKRKYQEFTINLGA